MYDVLIIGGGTAAMSAAIYAARKKLSVEIIADKFGGQTSLQPEVHNYPGFLDKDGLKLMQNMRNQVKNLGIEIKEVSQGIRQISSRQEDGKEIFILDDKNGGAYEGKSVIVASGKKPKKIGVPGEEEFYNKGVTYCATCDAPLFGEKIVAVIGGGNSGLDSAMQLTKYAKKVYILVRGDAAKGDQITQDKLKKVEIAEFVMNAEIKEIKGDKFVSSLVYKDKVSGEEKELNVEGVFVNIGMIPNSDFLKGFCELNQWGEVVINPKTNATSHVGVFAAGDVTDILEKQTVIAAGEGAKAALQCYKWLANN
ncbi:MAG: FAD-dependent oxidoreductase [Patescibacteria group bacterium]